MIVANLSGWSVNYLANRVATLKSETLDGWLVNLQPDRVATLKSETLDGWSVNSQTDRVATPKYEALDGWSGNAQPDRVATFKYETHQVRKLHMLSRELLCYCVITSDRGGFYTFYSVSDDLMLY